MIIIPEMLPTLLIAVILPSVMWVRYVTMEVGSVMEIVEEKGSYINTILIVIVLRQENMSIKIVPREQLVLKGVAKTM